MEYKDYYSILGVGKDADAKEIKRAYRKLARQHHPDKNPGNKASEEKLKEINEAYEVIGSPENRAKYDRLGRNYHRFQQMGGNPADFDFSKWFGAGGRGRRANVHMGEMFGGTAGSAGFSDFFESIFGSRGFGQARRQQQNSYGRLGRDIEQTINLTLEEAYHGTTRTLSQNGNKFTARIPRGAKSGTKIRLRGKGNPGPGGAGNLYLVVHVQPHPVFERDGHTLRVNVEVDVLTAVLGGSVTVPTLAGPVSLTIPEGTQGGQTFRLTGRGMPHLRDGDSLGDLLAKVQIRVPKQLSNEQRAHYEELAKLYPSASN
jgi:curved DNA-binding protein